MTIQEILHHFDNEDGVWVIGKEELLVEEEQKIVKDELGEK
jgi:hypothetical protein